MSKEVSFSARPPSRNNTRAADAFKELGLKPPPEPVKRLTINVPVSLHQRMKLQCVRDDVTIADVVREFLEGRFPGETVSR